MRTCCSRSRRRTGRRRTWATCSPSIPSAASRFRSLSVGREYLRIIYGPEYSRAENLERLRARAVIAKRGLALRKFALGVESLQRFVRREPLHRVYECVFAVLALESESV